jgi:hypothetical protein
LPITRIHAVGPDQIDVALSGDGEAALVVGWELNVRAVNIDRDGVGCWIALPTSTVTEPQTTRRGPRTGGSNETGASYQTSASWPGIACIRAVIRV